MPWSVLLLNIGFCTGARPMPRYFFNVHFDDHMARDPIGFDLPNLAEAIKQAQKAMSEIIDEDDLDRLWLEIVDEHGKVLETVGG
jgi:hypothetical protein